MAQLNFARREITTKIVYYGATDAGVSTNVEQLASAVLPSRRTEILRFAPQETGDPTLCFETSMDHHSARDFPLRATIYGMPGGLVHPGLRNEILCNVDAVVFVADARPQQEQANIESLLELERVLRDGGVELTDLPMVLQVNHTDGEAARSVPTVAADLNPYGFPVHAAMAKSGQGVLETLDTVVALLALRIESKLSGQSAGVRLDALHSDDVPDLSAKIAQHLTVIEDREEAAREAADPRLRYANLSITNSTKVRYQTEALRGTRPTQLLSAEIDGEDLVLDLIHERINGGEPRRLKLVVENRPSDVEALPQPQVQAPVTTNVTASLPDHIDMPVPQPLDLPPIAYGFIGLACGVVLGLLLGVIFFI